VQVHVFASESHNPDQPHPAVAHVPPNDDVFPGDLAAQFARAGLAPGLILFGRVDPGQNEKHPPEASVSGQDFLVSCIRASAA